MERFKNEDYIKQKLIRLGYSGNFDTDDIEDFLKKQYSFNVRDVDCYITYGATNDYKPAIELKLIPDGFFLKDYIKNETKSEALERSINLALDLIIRLKR